MALSKRMKNESRSEAVAVVKDEFAKFVKNGVKAGDKDGVTPVLQKAFNIKDMHPVEFMGGRKLPTKYNKTPGIIEHKVSIHYGDSDDDILAAKEAGIRGIRLMRAANSTYQPMPTLGGYGEEVLINSNY